jgi:TolB-like protein
MTGGSRALSFLAELRRRNVIRMVGLYLVGAWLVTQVAATLLGVFEAPTWVMKALVGVLAIGLLPTTLFAWVFELTPEGLKRDSEVPAEQSIAPQTARKMERMILVLFAAALAFFAFDRFVLAPKREAASVAAAVQDARDDAAITDKSIAVLPFLDMSQGRDQEWFGDGLAEEIVNALAKAPDLQVSARTSSFRYKGSKLSVPEIARELGVAHVLEGSIRSTPQRIRVTAQLIRAADGFHLWSQTYDRDPADVIEIQEDLARSIATAMQTSMDPKALADMAAVGTRSVEAYQAYIRGLALDQMTGSGRDGVNQAYQQFEKARMLDPGFAAAHDAAARFWQEQKNLTSTREVGTGLTFEQISKNYRERIDQAIELAATPAERTKAAASAAMFADEWRKSIRLYREYLASHPGDIAAIQDLLSLYTRVGDQAAFDALSKSLWPLARKRADVAEWYIRTGFPDAGRYADMALELMETWPDLYYLHYQSHRELLWAGRVQEAAEVLAGMQRIAPDDDNGTLQLAIARQACAEGRRAEVERMLQDTDPDSIQYWHLLELLGERRAASAFLERLERNGSSLVGFLHYPQFDPRPYPSLMRLLEREQVVRPPPPPLPFECPPATTVEG